MFGVDFSRRCAEAELIDEEGRLSPEEWTRTLDELRLVNRLLGGTRSALRPLKQVLESSLGSGRATVVDFGSGSADILAGLAGWARGGKLALRAIAMDRHPTVCRVARERCLPWPEITVIRADVLDPPLAADSCDLILCSAFLHHFDDRRICIILRRLLPCARSGLVVVDLHRHPLAWVGIRLLTSLFSRSPAIRHDGPLSVLRAFTRSELEELLASAGIEEFELSWSWPFRWVLWIPRPTALVA